VTKDSDFNDISVIHGFPPYIIWIRSGNSKISNVESIIRRHFPRIKAIVNESQYGIIELN